MDNGWQNYGTDALKSCNNMYCYYVYLKKLLIQLQMNMFRIASGYGIAKRLGRTLYFNTSAKYEQSGKVHKMLEHIQNIFPRSIEAFKLIKSEVIFETVPFADDEQGRETCCKYEDPLRYINNSAKFLELNTALVQNPLYFQDVMPDIREMFNFGECAIEAGMKKVRKMKMRNNYAICVHTRRTDFKRFGAASDLVLTLSATQRIAKENILQNLTEYVIFGDDQDFMGKLAKELRKNGSTNDETELETVASVITQDNEPTENISISATSGQIEHLKAAFACSLVFENKFFVWTLEHSMPEGTRIESNT
ncbi:hypothetical protein NECAME_00769 [Necator americanus]|uniref:L-Fucosyltransferase n=1 Tax=Necator americanus TaxID=51031 RepID=W2SXR6_NECAM|nr:hypothetical protein NECAME_00769 [Necator americanus]ETN73681.1 hypothetical protein NECAME_00769 [Necator americanus]